MSSNTILFVFEGEKIEEQIFRSIRANFFLSSNSKTVVRYYLSAVNIRRTFCLINGTYKEDLNYKEIKKWFEEKTTITKLIHESLYNKFIHPKNEIVVLSPFPLFLLYYFGERFFCECKCDVVIKTCSFSCYHLSGNSCS